MPTGIVGAGEFGVGASPLGVGAKPLGVGPETASDAPEPPPFAPSDIAGLLLWLKADSLSLSDNDPVSLWDDSSGNGNDAGVFGPPDNPIYKVNIINGEPVARFNNAGNILITPNFSLAQPCTIFVVTKYSQAVVSNDTMFDGLTSNSMRGMRSSATDVQEYAGAFGPLVTTTPEAFHAYSFIYDGASSTVRVDGGTAGTGNPGAGNGGGLTLNSQGGGGGFGGQDMAELLAYNSSLSLVNQNLVFTYLKAKYATP